ncbi:MAG: zinc ribbon domain-containing protein, partial [Proteobacteria bacterium]|nr:zinc ribbon domain-containing protein [Pseudomonadota bacterium]
MNCPKCQYPNAEDARFCVQCGTAFSRTAQASPAPTPAAPATPSGSNKTALIVLGVIFGVLLLFVVGIYTAFHMVASKVRALAGGDGQTSSQPQDASQNSSDYETQQGAQVTGNVIGNLLGTDAKGKSDIGKAIGNMAQAGQQIAEHDKANGNANGAPDAQDTQQAMGAVGGLLGALGHSLGGAHRHDPVDFHTLQALLPSSLSGMQRGIPRGEANQAMGIKASSADVDFNGPNDARINVSIKDASAISGLA